MMHNRHSLAALALGSGLLILAACAPQPLTANVSAIATTTASPPIVATTSTQPVTASAVSTVSTVAHTTAQNVTTPSTGTAVPTPAQTTSHQTTTASSNGQTDVAVYFTQGSRLVTETRAVPAAAPARGSLDALLAGPKATGHYSQVPNGTALQSMNLKGGTATVDLSSQIQNLEGSPAIPLFLAQVVDTLTQFPDVQRVVLEVNGQPVRTLGGEGVAVPEPMDRAAVQKLLTGV
jgi:spore germination protein GerM